MDSSSGCGSTSTRIIARCSSLRKALATMRSKKASSGSYADSEDCVADHAHEAAAPAAVDQRYAVLRERPAEPDGAGCGGGIVTGTRTAEDPDAPQEARVPQNLWTTMAPATINRASRMWGRLASCTGPGSGRSGRSGSRR